MLFKAVDERCGEFLINSFPFSYKNQSATNKCKMCIHPNLLDVHSVNVIYHLFQVTGCSGKDGHYSNNIHSYMYMYLCFSHTMDVIQLDTSGNLAEKCEYSQNVSD